jgi:hypothetical protein
MTVPPPPDGRHQTEPYRVRAGSVWYWVDPSVPADTIEPGDTVVVYPVGGHAVVAILQDPQGRGALAFTTPEGERFEVEKRDIAALHLAAVDDQQ